MENEILKEAVDIAPGKKVAVALALVDQGRAIKAVCAALGVARSNVHLQAMRAKNWMMVARLGCATRWQVWR